MDQINHAKCGCSTNRLLIKNVRLTDPGEGLDESGVDLLIKGGRVEHIASRIDPGAGVEGGKTALINGKGLWVWPGLIDAHVHFREPGFEYKENFNSGSRAAASGGFTSVICEPNTNPPLASASDVSQASKKAGQTGVIPVYFKAAMTAGREGLQIAEYDDLARLPEVVALSDDGDPVHSFAVMKEVCRRAAPYGLPLSPHCEDSPRALAEYKKGRNPGFRLGKAYTNEKLYVERDGELACRYGNDIHFSHLSLLSSLNVVRKLKDGGSGRSRVTCEVTPHHLLLCKEDFSKHDIPQVNPPLRTKEDMKALQKALCEGDVDAIACDHAPHSSEDKKKGACGFAGLETAVGLVLTYFVKPGRLTPIQACRLMSAEPAKIFSLEGGSVKKDAPADLVIIDPAKRWTVDPDLFQSRSRNTPFVGRRLTGKAIGTMVGGRFVSVDDDLKNRMC